MQSTFQESAIPVLKVLYRHRKYIIATTVLAAILSLVISFLLPVEYRASTTFYAASNDLTKPEKIFGLDDTETYYFGNDDDINRLLSFANSSSFFNYIIDSFELMEYYDIDPENPKAQVKATRALENDFQILQNEEEALELSMLHTSPEKAKEIVVAAANYLDMKVVNLSKKGQIQLMSSIRKDLEKKHADLKSYADTIRTIRKQYGIIEPSSQGEILSSLIATTESRLNELSVKLEYLKKNNFNRDTINLIESTIRGLQNKYNGLRGMDTGSTYANIENFNTGLTKFLFFSNLYSITNNDISKSERRLNHFSSAFQSYIPGIHIVDEAKIPKDKYKPVRSLIVLISTLSAFLFSILVVLFLNALKKLPWSEIKS